jgi:hypothetical protein
MVRTIGAGIFVTTCALWVSGCSTQQTYQAGQTWQRNECQKMADVQARGRCLDSASASFDAYQRQLEKDAKER